jgi:hypothetical protein
LEISRPSESVASRRTRPNRPLVDIDVAQPQPPLAHSTAPVARVLRQSTGPQLGVVDGGEYGRRLRPEDRDAAPEQLRSRDDPARSAVELPVRPRQVGRRDVADLAQRHVDAVQLRRGGVPARKVLVQGDQRLGSGRVEGSATRATRSRSLTRGW